MRACAKPAIRVGHGLCEMHYGRMRRNGNFDGPVIGRVFVAQHGYAVAYNRAHPMAKAAGVVYQHRAVHFDQVGAGPHKCRWCKAEVDWDAKGKRRLVVDHVNGEKADNRPVNLVTACQRCNMARGAFQKWALEHRDDPFLIELFGAAVKAA